MSTYNTYNYLLFNSTHYADVWRYRASYRQRCCAGYRGSDCQRAYFAYLKLKGRRLTIDKKQKMEFLLLYRYNPEITRTQPYMFHVNFTYKLYNVNVKKCYNLKFDYVNYKHKERLKYSYQFNINLKIY